MKVLITGVAGFIGSHSVEFFLKEGCEVVGVDNLLTGSKDNLKSVIQDFYFVEGDICDESLVTRLCEGVDVVCHQAAASSHAIFLKRIKESTRINVEGFINLLECAVKNNVKRVVYASSSSVYGNSPIPFKEEYPPNPIYMFSATKVMNEQTAKIFSLEKKIETIGLRYMSVYGSHEEAKAKFQAANLVTQFFWDIKANKSPLIYGDGTQTRDSVYVKDVARANWLAAISPKRWMGELVNVGTGEMMSLNEISAFLNRFLGKNVPPTYIPMPLADYVRFQKADLARAKQTLGFEPSFDLGEGLRDFVSF